jgi:hypothetical protein
VARKLQISPTTAAPGTLPADEYYSFDNERKSSIFCVTMIDEYARTKL